MTDGRARGRRPARRRPRSASSPAPATKQAQARTARPRTASGEVDAERILEATLALAAHAGWHHVRLADVADDTGIPLDDIGRRFPDLESVADALFLRARQAMIAPLDDAALSPEERLAARLERWFETLAPYRTTVRQILAGRLHPPHMHHWAPLPFHLSRLLQWLRDAARLDMSAPRRPLGEIGVTALFLGVLILWLYEADDAAAGRRMKGRVGQGIRSGGRVLDRIAPPRNPDG